MECLDQVQSIFQLNQTLTMQVEHEMCLEIDFYANARIEPIPGWMDSWTDGRKENHPCVLQDIGPLDLLRRKIILYKCMYES